MSIFVALLRGINVGGSGLLSMTDLSDICYAAGFIRVRTYIQSGNVIFESSQSQNEIRLYLEPVLKAKLGKVVDVMIRTALEMGSILSGNPFPDENPAKVAVAFLHGSPPVDLLQHIVVPGGELVRPGRREVYIFYPNGMGRSKLKLPIQSTPVTVRNMNTVAKLVTLARN